MAAKGLSAGPTSDDEGGIVDKLSSCLRGLKIERALLKKPCDS